MKDITFCLLDNDAQYIKAFMSVIASDYSGCVVRARNICGADCREDVDACIRFVPSVNEEKRSCSKAFQPACGRYAGVSAILREVKAFVTDNKSEKSINGPAMQTGAGPAVPLAPFDPGMLICVYALAGGSGTSVSAIGIGRELSRYRGEQVFYLSLEDLEDPALYPSDLSAMRSSEVLYRYFRTPRIGIAEAGGFSRLFRSAAMRDEYGLFRFAPDEGLCALAELTAEELYLFLSRVTESLGLTRIVLDFGTRLHFLSAFAAYTDESETIFINISSANKNLNEKIMIRPALTAAFTRCNEDIKKPGTNTEIGLSNTFGQEVKELCDLIGGLLQ